MKSVLLLLLAATASFAAIDGTVVNRTSGKPQSGVSITLLKPGQNGMRNLGTTVTDSAGRYVFQNDQPGGGPQLLQAAYKGVNYNKLLPPGIPTSNVEVEIFESTTSPAVAHIAQHMLVLEPNSGQTAVSETVLVQNDSKTTYNNEELGGLRFYLPPAANGQVRVNAQGPQGMPLPRPAEKTKEDDVFKVNFPIKPGQTEFDVSYVLPVGSPMIFHGRVVNIKGMLAGPLRLIAPSGVTLAGNDVQSLGTEPKTQATIYNVTAANNFSIDVAGVGSLRNSEDTAGQPDSDAPQVTEGRPQVYEYLPWLLVLGFSILGVGFVILYRSQTERI